MRDIDPKKVNKSQLSQILGKPRKVIDDWIKDGLPHERTGKVGYIFSVPEVFDWRIARAVEREQQSNLGENKDQKKARQEASLKRELAQADLAEENAIKLRMENAVRSGELIELGTVVEGWKNACAVIRARFLNLPGKLAPMLASENNTHVCQAMLAEAATEILEELSQGDITVEGDGGVEQSADSVEAPADDDSKPVGRRKTTSKSRGKRRAGKVGHKPG